MLEAGDNLAAIRDQLPDEFLGDLDAITAKLTAQAQGIVAAVAYEAGLVSHLSDKEVGLRLPEWPEPIRSFIFPYRKNGGDLMTGRARKALFRVIRPTGNTLLGYTPSYAINRVMDEAIG